MHNVMKRGSARPHLPWSGLRLGGRRGGEGRLRRGRKRQQSQVVADSHAVVQDGAVVAAILASAALFSLFPLPPRRQTRLPHIWFANCDLLAASSSLFLAQSLTRLLFLHAIAAPEFLLRLFPRVCTVLWQVRERAIYGASDHCRPSAFDRVLASVPCIDRVELVSWKALCRFLPISAGDISESRSIWM